MWRRPSGEPPPPRPGYLVPAAVVLRGGAVILQDFGDGALIDTLQVQLPLSEFQEAPEDRGTRPHMVLPPQNRLPKENGLWQGRTKAFLNIYPFPSPPFSTVIIVTANIH